MHIHDLTLQILKIIIRDRDFLGKNTLSYIKAKILEANPYELDRQNNPSYDTNTIKQNFDKEINQAVSELIEKGLIYSYDSTATGEVYYYETQKGKAELVYISLHGLVGAKEIQYINSMIRYTSLYGSFSLHNMANIIRAYGYNMDVNKVKKVLIMNNFCVDLGDGNVQYTRKGRKLMMLGSIESYRKYKFNKRQEKEIEGRYRKSEQQRNKYLFWITICIAISTAMQGFWNFLETMRNYYSFGVVVSVKLIIPIISTSFLLYISYIILKERPRNKKR